jgi:hypothetical protein
MKNTDAPLEDENDINEEKIQLRTKVAKYCVIDCYLVLLINDCIKAV